MRTRACRANGAVSRSYANCNTSRTRFVLRPRNDRRGRPFEMRFRSNIRFEVIERERLRCGKCATFSAFGERELYPAVDAHATVARRWRISSSRPQPCNYYSNRITLVQHSRFTIAIYAAATAASPSADRTRFRAICCAWKGEGQPMRRWDRHIK